ncbi:conserved exported hypothetical protein [Thiocapsa sp. KS1]|nr:DUF4431 domain-containing protein [Thiocapsa sp. KS1]CRI65468.1 conserved exported hypothetical protein [Thiocapsa sp. KS1]
MMKFSLGFLSLICALLSFSAISQTYEYAPTEVTLYGILISMPGEAPNGERYMYPALRLVTPISVKGEDEFSPFEGGLLLIQLALNDETMTSYKQLKGQRVNINGVLFHAHTGWHQTNVLLSVNGISESP